MDQLKPENYAHQHKESLDWYRSRLDLWVAFCRKYRVADDSVALFDCDDGGFVQTKEIGKKRMRKVLCRSEAMEVTLRREGKIVVDVAFSFLIVSIVAEPRNIHAHEANVVGKLSALGEQSDFAKEFGKHFSRWQPDAFAHRSNQALATVDFIVGCFRFYFAGT